MSTTAKDETRDKTFGGKKPDAIAILEAGHREIEKKFKRFETEDDRDRKKAVADEISKVLRFHMQLEEEIFYPASRDVLKQDDIVDKSIVEHGAAKTLMDEIDETSLRDDRHDARMSVLKDLVEAHIQEEEQEYFPAVRKGGMDLAAVGAELQKRWQELAG